MLFQPLEQFNVYLLHAVTLLCVNRIWFVCCAPINLYPSNWVVALEEIYNFLVKLFSQHVNNFHLLYYFPIISAVFFIQCYLVTY